MPSRRDRAGSSRRAALYNQQDLKRRLAKIINWAQHEAPEAVNALQLAKRNAGVVSKYFSETMDTKLYNEQRSSNSTDIAARAFSIPEILEMIRDELDHNELLESQLVNRHFRDTIQASPTLRYRVLPPKAKVKKRIGPRINIDGNIRGVEITRECRLCKIARRYDEYRYHRHCTKEGQVEVEDCERMIPWRCLDMQICEPPIHDMKIWIECRCVPEYDGDWDPDPFDHVSNMSGLTLNDLLEKARDLRTQHASCEQTPNGHPKGVDWTPDDITVVFGGDHGFICEKCSKDESCAPYTPPDDFDYYPDESDDDTYTDEGDESRNARLPTNRKRKQEQAMA